MPKKTTSLPENVRQTAIAAAPLLVVIVLFIFVGNFGISKVLGIRMQIASAQDSQAVLTQKLNLLQTLSPTAATAAPVTASAVPDSNPTLSAISQLRILALQGGIAISGIKSTSGISAINGMNEASVSFTADGTLSQIFSFLDSTRTIAPILVVDKITLTEAVGSVNAGITVKAYWAALPKTIPSIDAPVTDLTSSERDTLTKVVGLTQPSFTQVTPSQGGINPNPFGQ